MACVYKWAIPGQVMHSLSHFYFDNDVFMLGMGEGSGKISVEMVSMNADV